MDLSVFRSFVKAASYNYSGNTPRDYYSTRIAVHSLLPGLEKMGAGAAGHLAEIAGLGLLAKPTVSELRGKKISAKSKGTYELAGLGTLAVPSIYHLIRRS